MAARALAAGYAVGAPDDAASWARYVVVAGLVGLVGVPLVGADELRRRRP